MIQNYTEFRRKYAYDTGKGMDQLGSGSVYKALDTESNTTVVVKETELHANHDDGSLLNRLKAAEKFDYLHLVKVFKFYKFEEQGMLLYVQVMEWVDGNSLDQLDPKQWSEQEKALVLADILRALQKLHSHKGFYQLLMPSNVLIVEIAGNKRAKIINYGAENKLSSKYMTTMAHCAPEQFDERSPVTHSTDYWGFGIICYYLFTTQLPFGERQQMYSEEQIKERILNENPDEQLELLPSPFKELTEKCLYKDVFLRPQSTQKLLKVLESLGGIEPINQKNAKEPEQDFLNSYEEQPKTQSRRLTRPRNDKISWIIVAAIIIGVAVGSWFISDTTINTDYPTGLIFSKSYIDTSYLELNQTHQFLFDYQFLGQKPLSIVQIKASDKDIVESSFPDKLLDPNENGQLNVKIIGRKKGLKAYKLEIKLSDKRVYKIRINAFFK